VTELHGALQRYRVMAFVVGTGLLLCSVVGLPLQYGVGGVWVKVVPAAWTVHGFLYIVYLITAVDLARRARFTLPQIAATIGAGFLPLLAFFVEHRVNLRMQGVLAELAAGERGSPAAGAAPAAEGAVGAVGAGPAEGAGRGGGAEPA
jgi:integral membrane protein